jgi:hypothetical protein
MSYFPGYQSKFMRFVHSVIMIPTKIWLRWLCLVIPASNGIINRTNVPTATLEASWKQAATALATAPFPLTDANGNIHPADPRALTVQPKNVTVVSVPDVPAATISKYVQSGWTVDPTGTFLDANSGFLDYSTVAGTSLLYTRPRVYGAESVLANVCVYEFQNIILSDLGYDVSNR